MVERDNVQNYSDDEIDLREIIAVLWRWKWTIVLVTLAFMVLAFAISKFLVDPVYEARTVVAPADLAGVDSTSLTYVVNAEDSLQWQMSEDMGSMLKLPQVSIQNFNALLTSHHVVQRARQALKMEKSIAQIRDRVKTNFDKDTNTTEIVVAGTDPQENAELANVLVKETIAYVKEINEKNMTAVVKTLETQLTQAETNLSETLSAQDGTLNPTRREREIERREQMVDLLSGKLMEVELLQSFMSNRDTIIVLSPAAAPKNPVSPRIMLNTAVAAVLGFMLVIFAVFIMEYLRSNPEVDQSA